MRPLWGRMTQPGFLLLAYVPPECTPFLPPWLAHSTPLFFFLVSEVVCEGFSFLFLRWRVKGFLFRFGGGV